MGVAGTLIGSVKKLPRKLFGTRNDRLLKVFRKQVPGINELESGIRGDYDERFAAQCAEAKVDDMPEDERVDVLRQIRRELSQDLLERASDLRKRIAPHIEPIESWWRGLAASERADEHSREEFRKRDTKLTDALEQEGIFQETFAVLREASRRAQNHRHFDCQLIGGRVLYEGKIAEMRTGEGKTIVCHLGAFL